MIADVMNNKKDMIADVMNNKKYQAIPKDLFIRSRKINVSVIFISQSYFRISRDVRLNSSHFILMKLNDPREINNIANNHSLTLSNKQFINLYKKSTINKYSCFVIDLVMDSSDPLCFRKNLFVSVN